MNILERAKRTSMEAMIMKAQLRWIGHVFRMGDDGHPKGVFYDKLKLRKPKRSSQ